MSTIGKIVGGLEEVNKAAVTSTLIVETVSGLIGVIKGIITRGRESGIDVDGFDVAIASLDAAIATAQTRDAEYQQLRAEQEAAKVAEGADLSGDAVGGVTA